MRARQGCRRSSMLIAIFTLSVLGSGACTTTSSVNRYKLVKALKQISTRGSASERIVLQGQGGRSVRLDPRSRIRFGLNGSMVTEWIPARDLRTSALGVSVGTELIASWPEISFAEVENLSGGRVLIGVVVVAAVVAVVTALVLKAMKGKKEKNSSSSASSDGGGILGFGSGSKAHRRKLPVRRRHRVRVDRRRGQRIGLRSFHGRRRGPRLRGALRLAVAIDASSPRGQERPPQALATATRRPSLEQASSGAVDPEQPAPPQLRLADTRPLFSAGARRRSSYRFFGAMTLGNDFAMDGGLTDALTLGVRISELFELGGGFRHMLVDHAVAEGGRAKRASYLGFGRVGLNIDLGAGRYVAVPISVELGAGDQVARQWRLNWGLRVRPFDWAWIGIYPLSPTHTVYREDKVLSARTGWSFPSSVELGFSF
ncbi:MAG: hypothetical protein KAI47_09485 [Deltaproteobacteria bacterium]|nr:hypothetical protein [Deltaproteobacteria bacterium]